MIIDLLYMLLHKFDRNGMYSTTTKELCISLFMCFRIFNFGKNQTDISWR